MTAFGPGPGGRAFPVPSPAEFARRGPSTLQPSLTPPRLGRARHATALYWVETNIGIAFEYVQRLDMITRHYGDQLRIVEDVHGEWRRRAGSHRRPPDQYAPADVRSEYQQWQRVTQVCKRLETSAEAVLGEPLELDFADSEPILHLRKALADLPRPEAPPPNDDYWTHRGECATVRAAQLEADAAVAAGRAAPAQVMVTNDGKAGRLATSHGLAWRTSAEVLREMVAAGFDGLSAADAWALHQRTEDVTMCPRDRAPTGPAFFT